MHAILLLAKHLHDLLHSTHWCWLPCLVGLDWGGVRREFFTLLCCELFESSGLFTRFSEDHQALVRWKDYLWCSVLPISTCIACLQVHPNPNRPSSLKLKYYEFCGKVIGKCLYDSALGDIILVKARFTRSFLAQIIGLRVNYRVRISLYLSSS